VCVCVCVCVCVGLQEHRGKDACFDKEAMMMMTWGALVAHVLHTCVCIPIVFHRHIITYVCTCADKCVVYPQSTANGGMSTSSSECTKWQKPGMMGQVIMENRYVVVGMFSLVTTPWFTGQSSRISMSCLVVFFGHREMIYMYM
jgi:hypothetical protein